MSSALKLVKIEGKGRGFVSTKPLKGGQVVLRESPLLVFSAYPLKQGESRESSSSYAKYCGHCFRDFSPSDRIACPSCSNPDDTLFCSSKCYSMALSSTHSPWICKVLNYLRNCPALFDNDKSEERQVQARYLVTAYSIAMVSPSIFKTLLLLHGDGKRYMEIASFFHQIISSLPFPEGFSDLSIGMIAALLDKEMNNSFNLMGPARGNGEREIRAYGIYPNVSLFNHSCIPNACRFDYLDSGNDGNTDIIIRMIHDVPMGQEICLSYVRVNRNYADRKNRLLDYFGFECFCDRCKVEANSFHDDCPVPKYTDFAKNFVCDNENCGGTLAPLSASDVKECNYCGSIKNQKL